MVEYLGVSEINGPFVVLENVSDVFYGEVVRFTINGKTKTGQVVELAGDKAIIQVFEGTEELSLSNVTTQFTGKPMEMRLSKEILGRVFDGLGRPNDGLPPVRGDILRNVNGMPVNPVSRVYPRRFIQTGISSIDGLATLIRGQKLPVFSGNGLPHNELAAQIAGQSSLGEDSDEKFAVVFAAMGVKHDVADFFREYFEESGTIGRTVMFLNLAGDPVSERIITPKVALTAAEYLAYDLGMHVLVILTDMTSYAEALREVSSAKGEIPGRKGYPGYLYSEFASIYERAGIIKGSSGSLTQVPILTMPNDDITHPIPDLTGYITEGQIVLDRNLHQRGVYPPVSVLPSLSRLMKDGIGKGYTREDHPDLANQIFACCAKVVEVRSLASVIGEDELSEEDKKYMEFGREFESVYLKQGLDENRSIKKTIDLGWALLRKFPPKNLDRINYEFIEKYYGK